MLPPIFFRALRLFLGLIWLILLSPAQAFPALADHEQLFQTANGQQITPSDLLDTLNQADVSAWGEVHDNPRHHALRADLLRAMSLRGVNIVAEHMDAGKRIDMRQSLPEALARAGFDATGWQWPLHQVLFEAVQQTGLALYGGNIPANQTKEVFKSQGASVSAELQHLLRQARLDDASLKLLRQEIDHGHCSPAMPAWLRYCCSTCRRCCWRAMAMHGNTWGCHKSFAPINPMCVWSVCCCLNIGH